MNRSLSRPESPPPSAALGPVGGADPTFFLPKVEVSRIGGFLKRWGWLPVLLGLLGGMAGWVLSKKATKYYVSQGSVYVSTGAPSISEIQASTTEESRDLEQMQSVEQGMLSNMLLMRVAGRLGLDKDPSFASQAATDQQRLEVLAHRLEVALRRGTRLIDITVEDTDPERARRIVEAVKEEYEVLSRERQEVILAEMIAGLNREELRLREKMDASKKEVQQFRESHPVPGLEGAPGTGTARDELTILGARLTDLKAERIKLEAERDAFSKFDPENPDALAGLPRNGPAEDVIELVRQVREKELEFAQIKSRYKFKHPSYQRAEGELEETKKSLGTAMETAGEAIEKSYQIVVENEAKLEREVDDTKTEAVDVEGLRAEFAQLVREAENDVELHQQVSRQLREANLAGSVPASVLSWRDQPTAPEKPHRPRKLLMVGLGSALAFFLGAFVAAGLELSDRKVRGSAGAMRATGVPLLAQLPVGGERSGMSVLSDPGSALADAFRRLRVILAPKTGDTRVQTILFTAAKPGEGSSFCALNYAVSLAVEGHRTLLIDADLRTPGISREHLTQRDGESGLGGYLEGRASAADACVRTSVPALYLISSGEMRPDAAELLSRTRLAALLDEAGNWFDRVVIDSPAVLGSTDAQIVSRYADRTCLVVGDRGSDRRELREAAKHLRSAGGNLVGFIWNERPVGRGDAPSVMVARDAISSPSDVDLIVSPNHRSES